MNREERKKVQEPIEARMRAMGWRCHRTRLAEGRGWPDDVCHRRGRTLYLEFKDPNGEGLSPQQRDIIQQLRDSGMTVLVVEKWEDVEDYVE